MALDSRPGSTYFVPGVRIMRLGELRASHDLGTEIIEFGPDLTSVEVTRVNSGSSQYTLSLNNWYDTLPSDRTAHAGRDENIQKARPLWPRFKYNAFNHVNFGMRLRIDMRYWPDAEAISSESDAAVQRWVPMVAGPVTEMKFSFSASEGARLTVSGEDDLRLLKEMNKEKVPYTDTNEEDIINDVLRRAAFPLRLAESKVPRPSFFSGSKTLAEAHEEGQTHLDYLQKFADRYDFEIFLEFSDLNDPSSPLEFHMEPSRSRLPPDNVLRDIHVLERGRSLLEYTPTIKVLDQVTGMTVRGRHRVRSRPDQVQSVAAEKRLDEILSDELHFDKERNDAKLVSGPAIRRRIYGDNPATENNQSNLDEDRAEALMEGMLRRKAREFFTIEAQTIGLPRLRPGQHAEILGLRPPFDGFFYVTRAVHTYGGDGLRTKLAGRRPGMPMPPYGEGN